MDMEYGGRQKETLMMANGLITDNMAKVFSNTGQVFTEDNSKISSKMDMDNNNSQMVTNTQVCINREDLMVRVNTNGTKVVITKDNFTKACAKAGANG